MKLGQYIKMLEGKDPDQKVKLGLGKPFCWRGDYSELGFKPVKNTTIGEMLKEAKGAVGKTFEGHICGKFRMSEITTIHIEENSFDWTDGSVAMKMLLDLMLGDEG